MNFFCSRYMCFQCSRSKRKVPQPREVQLSHFALCRTCLRSRRTLRWPLQTPVSASQLFRRRPQQLALARRAAGESTMACARCRALPRIRVSAVCTVPLPLLHPTCHLRLTLHNDAPWLHFPVHHN